MGLRQSTTQPPGGEFQQDTLLHTASAEYEHGSDLLSSASTVSCNKILECIDLTDDVADDVNIPELAALPEAKDECTNGAGKGADSKIKYFLPCPGHRSTLGNSRGCTSFAQRLRHCARKTMLKGHAIEKGCTLPKKRIRRWRRAPYEVKAALGHHKADDDDSEAEVAGNEQDHVRCAEFCRLLMTSDVGKAKQIPFTPTGASLEIGGLQYYKDQSVCISETVAMVLAAGVKATSCLTLNHGRVAPVGPVQEYQLQRTHGSWILVADSYSYFNFLVNRWQPTAMVTHGPYAPVTEVLYLAFAPQRMGGPAHGRSAFFVKLGYRELVPGEQNFHDSLIGYVEKKSTALQLTNVPGAGIFVLEIPENHQVFARAGRAAEASLKTELLHNDDLIVTPSGHCGEVGSFSASLEYFFIEQCKEGCEPLAVLTHMLRSFSGNPDLLPQRAVAAEGGGLRRGRKHLQAWPQVPQLCEAPCVDVDCGYRAPLRTITSNLSRPVQALRSRAKCAQLQGNLARKGGMKRSRQTC